MAMRRKKTERASSFFRIAAKSVGLQPRNLRFHSCLAKFFAKKRPYFLSCFAQSLELARFLVNGLPSRLQFFVAT